MGMMAKQMSRKEVIETLCTMMFGVQAIERFSVKEREALDYARKSLETDQAYNITYEGGEVFTKDEVIQMLTDLQLEIEEGSYYDTTIVGENEDAVRVYLVEMDDVNDIIQSKIDALKGESGNEDKRADGVVS